MFKVIVTGKPSDFQERPDDKKTDESAATFLLKEQGYMRGKGPYTRTHWVHVPRHKLGWAAKKCEKGYTVMIEGDAIASAQEPHHFHVMMTEIHGL